MSLYGYGGHGLIGTTPILLSPGAGKDRPRNLDFVYPVGNRYGQLNYSGGVRFPAFNLPIFATPTVFTAANLNAWFMTRGASPRFDLPEITGGVQLATVYGDGEKMLGAKGAGFSFGVQFGARQLILNAQFQGTTYDATAAAAPAAIEENPLNFAAVTLGGGFASKGIRGITINYSNQLTPNESLAGTDYPSEHNADIPVCTVDIDCYALDGVLPPGMTGPNAYEEVTDATLSVQIATTPAVKKTTFSFTSLVLQNPNQRQLTAGRGVRRYRYNAKASVDGYPLTISETAV
jgi:hypothetical protein